MLRRKNNRKTRIPRRMAKRDLTKRQVELRKPKELFVALDLTKTITTTTTDQVG